jgi:DNA polymerase IV
LDHDLGRIFLAERIKDEILKYTSLTCSVGIAPNKLLAKLMAGVKKPDGLTYLEFNKDLILQTMREMKLTSIPGVGKVNN